MLRARITGLVIISIVMACSGCTSYASKPEISERVKSGKIQTISSFTFEIDSPWGNSNFRKDAYKVTREIIPNAKDNSPDITAPKKPELEIKIYEFSSGGACTQEYLTGLSLGLIPSWCTRPKLFKFYFTLNNSNSFSREKIYSINSTTFSHLIAAPLSIFKTRDDPLFIYQTALNDFLHEEQCEKS